MSKSEKDVDLELLEVAYHNRSFKQKFLDYVDSKKFAIKEKLSNKNPSIRFEKWGDYSGSGYKWRNVRIPIPFTFGIRLPITYSCPQHHKWSSERLIYVLKALSPYVQFKLLELHHNEPTTTERSVINSQIIEIFSKNTFDSITDSWRADGSDSYNPIPMLMCHSKTDDGIIGDLDSAWDLFKSGITSFHKIRIWEWDGEKGEGVFTENKDDRRACLVGYNYKTKTWYGWSRGFFGFNIGHTITKGSVIDSPDGGWTEGCPAYFECKKRWSHLKVGHTAKTLDDTREFAEAFASSLA